MGKPLTADQFRRTLDRLGLSQAGVADLLDLNVRTVRRYVSGDLAVPMQTAWALRGIEAERERVSAL